MVACPSHAKGAQLPGLITRARVCVQMPPKRAEDSLRAEWCAIAEVLIDFCQQHNLAFALPYLLGKNRTEIAPALLREHEGTIVGTLLCARLRERINMVRDEDRVRPLPTDEGVIPIVDTLEDRMRCRIGYETDFLTLCDDLGVEMPRRAGLRRQPVGRLGHGGDENWTPQLPPARRLALESPLQSRRTERTAPGPRTRSAEASDAAFAAVHVLEYQCSVEYQVSVVLQQKC